MSDVKLVATTRERFGKGAARQARREGKIPAIVYSHGGEARSILVDAHETFLVVKNHRTSLINIDIDGKNQKTIIKDVQRDPIGRVIEHIDFLAVRANEKQAVEVPVILTGEPEPGAQAQLELLNAQVEAVVTALPEHVEVNVEGLAPGTVIYAKDLTLPKGQTLITDEEAVIAVVNEIHVNEEPEDETADGTTAVAPATAKTEAPA